MKSTALSAWLLLALCLQAAPVRVSQDTMQLAVQVETGADPNPAFPADTGWSFVYPYAMRNQIKPDRPQQDVRILILENEYLLCRILPDFGGRLYSCRDKRNDREMFYANPIFGKDFIGIRGAWTPAGIENNFPVAHARDGLSAVDFRLNSAEDGSGRAVLENLDRVTGMQWRVEFILRPESTSIEQRVSFYNASPVRGSFYWWANAAVAYDDPDMRFVLPSRIVAEHGRVRFESFPITSTGSDESRIAGHTNGTAWFAYGSAEPFFGVYKPKFRGGVAHFADAKLVPGKKLWLWGSGSDSYVREKLTGNNFPSYVEIQAGVFQDQEIFGFMLPEESRQFSEYWIAVNDLGGISRVTRDATLNLARGPVDRPGLLIELSVTHPVAAADIRVLTGGEVAFQDHLDLTPASNYQHVLDSPASSAYTVQLVDAQGTVLLEHTENQYDARAADQVTLGKQPDPPAPDLKTEAGLLAHGNDQELQSKFPAARQDYATGMKSFPDSVPLRKAAGRLALTLNRFDEAADWLSHSAAAGDDEVTYLLSATRTALGQSAEARQLLSTIDAASPYSAAARMQLTLAAARDGDYVGALAALQPTLDATPVVARPGALEVALLRRAGRKPDASRRLVVWRELDPADNMLRFERTLLGDDDADLWRHLGADAERLVDLADQYVQLGMYEEAVQLLDRSYPPLPPVEIEPGAVPPAQSPLVAYYRAWCRSRLKQDSAADLKTASGLPVTYIFPFRPSSMPVLQYAVDTNGSDANAHFLLGRLWMWRLQIDEAKAEIKKARALNPKLPELSVPPVRASAPAPAVPANGSPVELAQNAMLQAASGNASAAGVFNAQTFPAEKQPDEVRRAYIEVQLQRWFLTAAQPGQCAGVLDAMEKLGDEDKGLPFTFRGFANYMKAAHFQYYVGAVMAACGQTKDSRKRWERVFKMKEPLPSPEFAFPLLAAAKLSAADAKPRIEGALADVRTALRSTATGSRASLMYLEGMLLAASGQPDQAIPRLQEALDAAPDIQLKYLAKLGLRDLPRP